MTNQLQASDGGWRLLEAVLGFFYPERCQICGQAPATNAEGYVCGPCRAGRHGVRPIRAPLCDRCGLPFAGEMTTRFECSNCREMRLHFSRARAAVVATDLVLEVIHRYKYHRALWFEPFLTGLLVAEAAPRLRHGGWDCIVPVPLYPVKEREREFNQAERLGAELSAATGVPLNRKLIKRVEHTRTQTKLTRAERAVNMRNAFALCVPKRLPGVRVVLVDDVLTTGATTSACAQVLKAAGAEDVCVWTVARGV